MSRSGFAAAGTVPKPTAPRSPCDFGDRSLDCRRYRQLAGRQRQSLADYDHNSFARSGAPRRRKPAMTSFTAILELDSGQAGGTGRKKQPIN